MFKHRKCLTNVQLPSPSVWVSVWRILLPLLISKTTDVRSRLGFCSKILKEMCYYLNTKKVQTMPYHPQSNGEVEMAHQTLQQMIRKLDNKLWKNWSDHLSSITHLTIQQDHRLLAILPDDVPKTKGVYDVKALHGCLRDAINATLISSDQEAARHKCLYDHRAGVVELVSWR